MTYKLTYITVYACLDVDYNGPLVVSHVEMIKPECLYGPQAIDMIMRKTSEITISHCITCFGIIFNRIFIYDQILQFIVSEFNT